MPHPDRSTKSSEPDGREVQLTQVPSVNAQGTAAATFDGTPFLGRTRELMALEAAFERAAAGHGTLVMVGGEGGIGKTRLVSEAISRAGARSPAGDSGRVAWGRCWDSGGAPSLWPWTCILRELFSSTDDEALRDHLGPAAPVLAAIVPELRDTLPELEAEPALDSEQSRFVLFDALAGFLRRASTPRPLVIVFDDLHAADQLSLLALLFVARQLAEMGVLVIATHREAEMRASRLANLFSKLLRASERVPLTGLEPDNIGRLIEHRGGTVGAPEIAEHLHRATGGNPFFADEVLRMLQSEGGLEILTEDPALPLRVPIGVRALIEQRLEDLPEGIRAGVAPRRRVRRPVRARDARRGHGAPARRTARGARAGDRGRLIDATPGEVAKFSFAHDLIRETAYAGLGSLERARAHAAVGEALARRYAGTADRHVEELAHHFLEALPAGDPAVAADYAERAADHAMERFAHERAAQLYHAAGEALELVDGLSDEERSLPALRAAPRPGPGSAADRRRHRRARRCSRPPARPGGGFGRRARPRGARVRRLRALAPPGRRRAHRPARGGARGHRHRATPRSRPPARRLARALYWSEDVERRRALIDEAIAMARTLDEEALASALGNCIPASRGPDNADLELSWIDELLSLSKAPGSLSCSPGASRSTCCSSVARSPPPMRRSTASSTTPSRLRDLRARAYVPVHRARRAIMEGRDDDARRLIAEAFAISQDIEESTVPLIATGHLFALTWSKGRPGGVEQELRRIAEALPYMHVWRCGLADPRRRRRPD